MAASGFGPDQIRILVSNATDSSHRVIMGKQCLHVFSAVFEWILFILVGNMTYIRAWMSLKFGQICPPTTELAALEHLKNPHRLIMGKMMSPLFLTCL